MRVALSVFLVALVAGPASAVTADVSPYPATPSDPEGSFPIVYSWGIPDDPYCVGIGWDMDGQVFWVSAGDQAGFGCRFYIYDDLGNLLDTRPQAGGATGWGHRDMTWHPCYPAMLGSYGTQINGFDGASVYLGSFTGPGMSPCRALTCDMDYVYTTGFGEYLWRGDWDCTWGSNPTWEMLGANTWPGAYGLARCTDCIPGDGLWMTTADYSGDLLFIDLAGGLVNTFTTLPEYDIHGGCEMADTPTWGCALAILMQSSPDQVVLYDVCQCVPVEEASWGQIKAMFE